MVSCCNRRLYKGNSYEICLPITDTGVTSVKFYTNGDVVVEKEGEIVDDMMCFELAKEELDLLPDGVLRYSYDGFDSSAGYVVVTPRNYSASTLDDMLEEAFDSGYTAGQETCSGGSCEGVWEEGYDSGYTSGKTDGYYSGFSAGEEFQRSQLGDAEFSINARYLSPTAGWSSVTVNVQPRVTAKYFNVTKNGQFGLFPEEGYDGFNAVIITADVPDRYEDGYYSGFSAGEEFQRSRLGDGVFTMNARYLSPTAGWSSVTVNVQDRYQEGYTSGYTDGLNDCSGGSCEGVWEAGYASGYTAGQEDCSGYTQEDLDAAFASGWSAGYDSGLTDCSGETPSAATAITITVPQGLEPGDTGSTSVSTSPTGAPTNLSYSSSDNSVATVDNNGNITAVGTGTTNICVTDSISQITECAQLTINNPGPGPQPSYSSMPLTFEIISGGTIGWNNQVNVDIEYSVDCGSTWSTFNNPISVNAGDMVQFRGTGRTATGYHDNECSYFTSSGALFNVCGNLYSLLDKTNYATIDDLTQYSGYTFFRLFYNNAGLISAENLMVKANTLAEDCYRDLFYYCTNLTTAPELPASVLVSGCYWNMFNKDINLSSVRCYAIDHSALVATNTWLFDVSPTGTFYKHPNATWDSGWNGIPTGWTVVDIQP